MTNEELKNMLFIIDTLLDDAITDSTRQKVKDKLTEVCQLAMKALEQQPMRDATEEERKSVKDYIESISKPTGVKFEAQPSEDCVSREAVLDIITFEDKWLFDAKSHNADTKIAFSAIKSKISELPSVKPERPKGKWIEVLEHRDEFGSTWHYECSECGGRSYKGFEPLERYCPNCGAEMGGVND